MGKNFPRPTGELQGDDSPMPSRGTRTGLDHGGSEGFDLGQDAINRQGGISGSTKSHSPDEMPGCNNRRGC